MKDINNQSKSVDYGIDHSKKGFKSGFRNRKVVLALLGLLALGDCKEQNSVNDSHENMDFVFSPENLSTEELIKYVLVTPEYSNKFKSKLSQYGVLSSTLNGSNSIFVSLKYHNTLDDKKKAIDKIRKNAPNPILISADFEGGYVHTFDVITDEDIGKYGIPMGIMDLRKEEASINNRVSSFPSAEFLGKKYKDIVLNGTYQDRFDFLIMMQSYGESIRRIMEDIGVDIVYGPCVDIVPDFDGDTPIAKDDRSFGDNFVLGQDLISAFIDGFQDPDSHVLLVPKHYVGVGASNTDPHEDMGKVDRNRDSGTEVVFRNIINGENSGLNEKKNQNAIGSYNKSKKKDEMYGMILQKNKEFIAFLNEKGVSLENGENIKALMTTHAMGLWGINEAITYSDKIISELKSRVGKKREDRMGNGIIFSDDLAMKGADLGLPKGVKESDVNKIILALSSGHDVVLDLDSHSKARWDKIISEVAKQIDSSCDIDGNGRVDLTRDMLYDKVKKNLDILVRKGDLDKTSDGKYQLKDATYFDPTIGKVIRDAFYSNQGFLSGSGIKEYKAEGNGKSDMITKKGKALYERYIHNGPNAVWKVLKVLFKKIKSDDDYKMALEQGKKLVIVDKSECKLFVFTIDGKTLLETHNVGVGKGSSKLDYKHDRRILGDDKTPVGYYMVVDRVMGGDQLRKDGLKNVGWYGGENGGLISLAGPWTPYVAIHGTLGDIGPSSNACVRVLDGSEVGDNVDKTEQKAINHISNILPDGSFVIITN